MTGTVARHLLAELVGTALLVLFGAGSVLAALSLGDGRLDPAGLGFVALAFGLVVALVVYAFGPTSGAHVNPAVTLALAATGRFAWSQVPGYLMAQLGGATLGALGVLGVVGRRATELGGVGLTAAGPGTSPAQAVLAETLGTFLLVLTVMALAVDSRAPAGWAGLVIGLAVTVEILAIGPVTGGSVNPARTWGPYLVNDLAGGSTPWAQLWVYVVGPVVGAVLAALVYAAVARPPAEDRPIDPSEQSDAPVPTGSDRP